VCAGQITGFGPFSYHLAMVSILQIMSEVSAMKEAQQAQIAQSNLQG